MQPTPVYPGWFDRAVERIARADPAPDRSAHAGAEHLHGPLADAVDGVRDDLLGLSHDIHDHPELGFAEHHAARAVADLLARHDVTAEVGVGGLDTALRARVGEGDHTVAVIAEYDALPEIGHACGHNVICATAVGAFLALQRVGADRGGVIELLATPAEEGGGGKEIMARAGVFDDVDVVLMVHPFGLDISAHPWLGVRQVEATYHGLAAHAAMLPFQGRNALDAVVQAYTAIGHLRQHILPSDRVHGIITDGGAAPNIVPDRATVRFYVRSAETETLMTLADRVDAILHAAATATGTELELTWDPCPVYLPVRNNRSLAARYATNLVDRGRTVLPPGVGPTEVAASTDLGNLSVRVPAIHPLLAIAPPEVIIHSADFAQWAASTRADVATVDGAVALARTAADYLHDPELRQATADEFAAQGGPMDVLGLLS